MLGFISNMLLLEVAKPGYSVHKRRIDEVLADLGSEIRLPAEHRQFRADQGLRRAIAVELKMIGKVVTDFYSFGTSAFFALVEPLNSRLGRCSRRDLSELCSEYDLDFDLVKFLVRRDWARGLSGNALIHELVSRAYDLGGMPIAYAQKEEKTCLVIMPFAEPFRGYYSSLYAPALRLAGYQPVRAWEGVSNERYLRLLMELIHSCGASLADISPQSGLSTPNMNVIHEIGMNMAARNVTFLVRQRARIDLPSNFIDLPFIIYNPEATDWPKGQAKEMSRALREIQRHRKSRERVNRQQ